MDISPKGIPKSQLKDHMRPKRKEDLNVDASVLFRRVNKILTGRNMETKCGAETEGKSIQRLPQQGIHPIYIHQTRKLFQGLTNGRLILLSPERLYQCLTNTDLDSQS